MKMLRRGSISRIYIAGPLKIRWGEKPTKSSLLNADSSLHGEVCFLFYRRRKGKRKKEKEEGVWEKEAV